MFSPASSGGGAGASSRATGVFDALQGTSELHLSELNVGRGGGVGSAEGQLRWDQPDALHASLVYFGRGGGATGILDVPENGTLKLGTADDPVSTLRIAYTDNDILSGAAVADLDFTVTNPTFEAYIQDELSIGRKVRFDNSATADGSLILGSNSILSVGTADDPAALNIGWNETSSGGGAGASSRATGVFDTSLGTFTANLQYIIVT